MEVMASILETRSSVALGLLLTLSFGSLGLGGATSWGHGVLWRGPGGMELRPPARRTGASLGTIQITEIPAGSATSEF